MNDVPFLWPDDATECAKLARSMFIADCVSNARYWIDWGSHLLTHPEPETPFARSWSKAAKEARAFRDIFATLTEQQRDKTIELLQRCVRGAVFSSLCTLDQFPHGEAEIVIRDGVCDSGTRTFHIAPTGTDLHDEFATAFPAP